MYQINALAFWLYAAVALTCLNVCIFLAIAYPVPYRLRLDNIFIFWGVKMIKTVKLLSSYINGINVHKYTIFRNYKVTSSIIDISSTQGGIHT